MPQARGTQSKFVIYDEDTYGADPAAPAGQLIRVKSFGLSSSQEKIDSETIPDASSNRERFEPMDGNIDVAGPVVTELDGMQEDKLFKHAMGTSIIARPVSTQPTNVTGVEILRAEQTCTPGIDGVLAFVSAASTLQWTAPGDTAGAAVDVSAGGTFTLQSGTANESLDVSVTVGNLPGADASDTAITVVNAYQKEFTPGDLPVGMAWDKDYGANISSTPIEHFNGCRIASMSVKFPQKGPIECSFEFKGSNSVLQAALLDAAPVDNGHTSFSGFNVTVQEGGAGIAVLTEGSLTYNNELDDSSYTIPPAGGVAGIRTDLPEGFAMVTGSINALFSDVTLINKAINNTESSLQYTVSRGDGWGTAGNESVIFQLTQLKYARKTPPIEGPGGVKLSLDYKGYRSNAGLPGLKIIVRNMVDTF